MRTLNFALPASLLFLTTTAAAQAPIWVDLGPGTTATDVTVVNGEVFVVGTDNSGSAFLWSSVSGSINLGSNAGAIGATVRMSTDATAFMTNNTGMDGISRASLWSGGTTWTAIPGIGGVSGTVETSGSGLSGDGSTVVGLGWTVSGAGHAFRSSGGTTVDLTPPFSGPTSRAHNVNGNGNFVVGWDQNPRYGARWVNGVRTYFVYTAPNLQQYAVGEAFGVNTDASVAVGYHFFNLTTTDAWRWDAGTNTITRLPNLPGQGTEAVALDVTDDGSLIVGDAGVPWVFGTTGIIWIQNQPLSLYSHLVGLGCVGVAGYTDVGAVTAISGDGGAICGRGTGVGLGQPVGAWVVYSPGAFGVGTVFCSGDGSGTACPCGNNGVADNGCANSVNPGGGHLAGTGGVASLANDTITLGGSGMPNSSALYFQGTSQQGGGLGSPFGDGLRCAGGTVIRLGTKLNSAGASMYPGLGDQSVSVRGNVTVPGTRTYQCWYRNAAAFCTVSTFNLTNGLELTWAP